MKLLDFTADWCSQCKQQKPIVEELADEYTDLRVEYIDVEDDQRELANEYHVRSLPTLILLDEDGEPVDRFVGRTDKQAIVDAIQ